MRNAFLLIAAVTVLSTSSIAAERAWQTGTWVDVSTRRRMVDFGPGSSGFERPGSSAQRQAMADVRRMVIETGTARYEIEDTALVNRQSFEISLGAMVTFAVEKNSVYIRMGDGSERRLRLIKKSDRIASESGQKSGYAGLGGGHVLKAIAEKGRLITLEDGSRWEISPRDLYQTADWEPSANITVRALPREEGGFGYELINTSTDEGAVARQNPER